MTSHQSPDGLTKLYRYGYKGRLEEAESQIGRTRVLSKTSSVIEYQPERSIRTVRDSVTSQMGRQMHFEASAYVDELFSDVIYPGETDNVSGSYYRTVYPDESEIETVLESGIPRHHAVYPNNKRQLVEMTFHPRWQGTSYFPSRVRTTQGDGPDAPQKDVETFVELELDDDNPLVLVSTSKRHVVNGMATSTMAYEAASRELLLTTASGRLASWQLREDGGVQSYTAQGFGTFTASFADDGRIALIEHSDGSEVRDYSIVRTQEGDLNVSSVVFPDGSSVEYWATRGDRIVAKRWTTDGATVAAGYDVNGRIQEVVGPDEQVYRFDYDAEGRLVLVQTPDPSDEFGVLRLFGLSYNDDTQLLDILDSQGDVRMAIGYDEAGRMTSAQGAAYSLTYGYDPGNGIWTSIGRAATDAGEDINVDLSWQGELLRSMSWSGAVQGEVSYAYDNFFYRSSQSIEFDSNEWSIPNQYNFDGLLASRGSYAVSRETATGLRKEASVGGIVRVTSHNGFGEVTAERYERESDGTVIFEETMTRLPSGFMGQRDESFGERADSVTYSYDGRRRLVKVSGNVTYDFAYDASDNIVTRAVDGVESTWLVNVADQLKESELSLYDYDEAGRLVGRTQLETGAVETFTYDADDQLTEVILRDGRTLRYILDGFGNPVMRLVDGVETHRWVFDLNRRPVAERRADSGAVAYFVYTEDEYHPAYMVQDGQTHMFLTDARGNSRGLVDVNSGVVREMHIYSPFGRRIESHGFDADGQEVESSPLASSFGFAGGLEDPDTGMVWLQSRWYVPEAARWNRRDPSLYLSGQWNLYAYSYNNPINYIDSNGRLGHVAAGCAIGAATVGIMSAGISAMQGNGLWCSVKAGFGGAVGGCAGGALGALTGGGMLNNMWTNGVGNMVSSATNMATGVQDAPDSAAGVAHELAGAFEDGAAGGFVSAPGAHSGSALIDDVVSNAATTGAGGGYNAARTWNP